MPTSVPAKPLVELATLIKARIDQSDYWTGMTNPPPVVIDDKHDIAAEVQKRAAEALCAVMISLPEFDLTALPRQFKVTLAINVAEHVIINRSTDAGGCGLPAAELCLAIALLLNEWAPTSSIVMWSAIEAGTCRLLDSDHDKQIYTLSVSTTAQLQMKTVP